MLFANGRVAFGQGFDSGVLKGISPVPEGDIGTEEGYVIPLGKPPNLIGNATIYGVNHRDQVIALPSLSLLGFDSQGFKIRLRFLVQIDITAGPAVVPLQQ